MSSLLISWNIICLSLKLLMNQTKPKAIKQCFCEEYRESEHKLKLQIMDKLECKVDTMKYTPLRLFNMYLDRIAHINSYWNRVENLLRQHFRQSPTLEYSQQDDMVKMVQTVISKLNRQSRLHMMASAKEGQIIDKYAQQAKIAQDQVQYLKQLLSELRFELDSQKKAVSELKQEVLSLTKCLSTFNYQAFQLNQIKRNHCEESSNLHRQLRILTQDKEQLSRQVYEKTEEVTRLAEELQSIKQTYLYQAKMEILEKIEEMSSRQGEKHYPTKSEMIEYLESCGKFGKPFKIVIKGRESNDLQTIRSHFTDRYHSKQDSYLNRTISTINPEQSRIYSLEKHHVEDKKDINLYGHLFAGDVLANQQKHRQFLVSHLQKFKKNLISRTKLLYKWDLFNNANIHQYIDGHSNIVMLVKTENNWCLGAYSQAAFKPNSITNQTGLLISFHNHLIFSNTKKAIIYDENEIIFGNYDLKIKSGDNKISSNFASLGSFYDNQGYGVHAMLGQGKNRQAKIKELEIYQLIFQS